MSQKRGDPVNQCMDVYKSKSQYGGNIDKIKLRIVVREDLQNKHLIGNIRSPKSSMRTLKYSLADAVKHKAIVHQFDFIGSLLHGKVKNWIFVKLDSRYADYFPEYLSCFERVLRLLKSMYVMANSGKLFYD